MKRTTACFSATLLALSLAACGTSEPSEDEMFESMAAWEQQAGQKSGSPEKLKEDMKKVGCEKAGEKTYKCMVGRRDGTGIVLPLNFTKSDGKWLIMQGN